MSQGTQRDDAGESPLDGIDIESLAAGDGLAITYDGSNGPRTITVYVVRAFDPYAASTLHDQQIRIRAAEPGARRSRFVQFDITDGSVQSLRSLNSKGARGQRLGHILDVQATGEYSAPHYAIGEMMAAEAGDIVRIKGRERVVVDRTSSRITVEARDGGDRAVYSAVPRGMIPTGRNTDRDPVAFARAGERTVNGDAECVYAAIESWAHGDGERKVNAITVDGTRYEIVYRHDDEVKLASPHVDESRRPYDARLTVDPVGLRLTTWLWGSDRETVTMRPDADDVELLYEGAGSDDEGDEDESESESEADAECQDASESDEEETDEGETDAGSEESPRGATDAEVRAAIEAAEAGHEPELVTDGGTDVVAPEAAGHAPEIDERAFEDPVKLGWKGAAREDAEAFIRERIENGAGQEHPLADPRLALKVLTRGCKVQIQSVDEAIAIRWELYRLTPTSLTWKRARKIRSLSRVRLAVDAAMQERGYTAVFADDDSLVRRFRGYVRVGHERRYTCAKT